jgi:GntR family transcriptional regulator
MSDPLSRHPLYQQVADALAESIAQGVWKPGASIPNELELARQMGVSAGTMRKALDWLETNRLIVRRQGRGTFVEDHSNATGAHRYDLLRDADGNPLDLGYEVLSHELDAATEAERSKLALTAGDRVLRTRRVRHHRGQPRLYETTILAVKRFPRLNADEAANESIPVLAQKYGVILGQAVEELSLCPAGEEAGAALSLPASQVLVRFDRVVKSLAGAPVEWRVALGSLRNDYYAVLME